MRGAAVFFAVFIFAFNSVSAHVSWDNGSWSGVAGETSAYEINNEMRIIVLVNSTGLDVKVDTLRSQFYRVLKS